MSNTVASWIFIFVVVALVAAIVEWRSRRRARDNVAREFSARHLDAHDMSSAAVDAGGDESTARRMYTRRRVWRNRRAVRRSAYHRLGRAALYAFLVIFMAGTAYGVVERVVRHWPFG